MYRFFMLRTWLILGIGLLLSGVSSPLLAQTPECQSEYDALMALYNDTNGPGWTNQSNWNNSSCPCDPAAPWYGVTCNGQGEVIGLNLAQNGMSGTLPRTDANGIIWDRLPALAVIDFSGNSLTGLIPPEIGSLTALRDLNLADNTFKGIFPDFLVGMSQLEILNLNSNELLGPLPTTIDQMTSLVELSLGQNGFTTVPSEIGNLTQLQRLTLSANPIASLPLPTELWTLPNLSELGLSDIPLTTLPSDIASLNQLAF
ncbi:MAG: hypothetical protein AAF694_16450, partial [Bacteroidota bacterium]